MSEEKDGYKYGEEVPGGNSEVEEVDLDDLDDEEEVQGIQVEMDTHYITITEEDRYVKGKKVASFGQKRKMKNLSMPKKLTVKGEKDPVTLYMDDYDQKKDLDIYILERYLKEWSPKKKVNLNNILEDEEVNDLMERYVEEFKKYNGLTKTKEDEEEEKN